MNAERLAEYLEQNRVIKSIDGKLLFWKNKDNRYNIEINDRMKMSADDYRLSEDLVLSFYNDGEEVLRTGVKVEDLAIYDEIIGRVFEFKGGHAWLFAFAVHNDVYDCMVWNDEESQHREYRGEEIHKMWSENKISGLSDAESSAEKILEFMKMKVVKI